MATSSGNLFWRLWREVRVTEAFAPAAEALRAHFGDDLLTEEPLAKHTSIRVGGPAALYLPVGH